MSPEEQGSALGYLVGWLLIFGAVAALYWLLHTALPWLLLVWRRGHTYRTTHPLRRLR